MCVYFYVRYLRLNLYTYNIHTGTLATPFRGAPDELLATVCSSVHLINKNKC